MFTRNALVLIVPSWNPADIRTVFDLRRKGIKLVIADKGVPVGDYTLQVLQNLNLTGVLKHVVSRENDVREVLAKVALDEADAGFVYATDARTAPRRCRRSRSRRGAAPKVQYGICVVSASHNKPRRERVRQARAQPGGPEDPAALRLPAARQAVKRRRALLGALVLARRGVALAFLVLPLAAIFLRVPPGKLLHQLSNPVVTDALIVSAKTSRDRAGADHRLRHAARLPAREPPLPRPRAGGDAGRAAARAAAGGRGDRAAGALRPLGLLGTSIPFTQTAVVLAVAFVSSPLYIRQAIAAFEAVDPNLVAASRTLGAGPARTFFRVVLPLARGGLAAGEALAFARGLGEFGATIMFAGSLQGVTQTLPLAIYSAFALDFDTALAMGALLVVVSAALLVILKLVLTWQPSRQTSSFLFARSS